MQNSKSIGNKIASARKKANLSQAELAQQISISPQAVGKWERGESMPDIITLNRIAEIFDVDLNYFSDSFQSTLNPSIETSTDDPTENKGEKKSSNWNLSEGNWANLDFSGLKNLKDKFSSSNVKNCKFIDSDFSALLLRNNNFDGCDFSNSDFSNCQIQKSNLAKNNFTNVLFTDANFSFTFVNACNLSGADMNGVHFKYGGFEKNTLSNTKWKSCAFSDSYFNNVIFEGTIEDCAFEKCTFSKVTFQNAKMINTFFKYNELKRVTFVNCQADKLTYELLKHGKADMSGIELI